MSERLAYLSPTMVDGLARLKATRNNISEDRIHSEEQAKYSERRWVMNLLVLGLVAVSSVFTVVEKSAQAFDRNSGFTFDVDCKRGKYNKTQQYPQVTITNEGFETPLGGFLIDYGDGKQADFFVQGEGNFWPGMKKRSYERPDGYEQTDKEVRIIIEAMVDGKYGYFGKVIASSVVPGKCKTAA